jgi:hypothetical protein
VQDRPASAASTVHTPTCLAELFPEEKIGWKGCVTLSACFPYGPDDDAYTQLH